MILYDSIWFLGYYRILCDSHDIVGFLEYYMIPGILYDSYDTIWFLGYYLTFRILYDS